MKVFTNKNFASGKAHAAIAANRIVGLNTTSGNVVQATATTVPIGVSHNYAADADQPITVLPIGSGFARVTAGATLQKSDLGAPVGPDAQGKAIKSGFTHAVGILAGLSADVEGETGDASAGDDVVVLLTSVVIGEAVAPTKGTAKFTILDSSTAGVEDAVVTLSLGGTDTVQQTDSDGETEFELDAGTYTWTAVKAGYTILYASGSVEIKAGEGTSVNLYAAQETKGTAEFFVKDSVSGEGVAGTEISVVVGDLIYSGTTGASGKVSFLLEEGQYDWTATPTSGTLDNASGKVDVTAGEIKPVVLTLTA